MSKRYSVRLEWCGYPERRYVVRFQGVGQAETLEAAAQLCAQHANAS